MKPESSSSEERKKKKNEYSVESLIEGIDLQGLGRHSLSIFSQSSKDPSKPLEEYGLYNTKIPIISSNFSGNLEESIISLEKILKKSTPKEEIIKNNYSNNDSIIDEGLIKNKYINKNKIKIPNLTNSLTGLIQSSFGINLKLTESASITADNIGEFALPIVEYIHQTQPDYVIASDRGARLLGLAVFKLYRELHGTFPTADGTLRFRRFSKSNTQEETEQHLRPLVDEMLAYKKRPTVLIIDDWICSGSTKRLAQQVFDKLSKGRIKTKFGVLVGNGADVSGDYTHNSGFTGITDWRDDSNIIGVMYGKDMYGFSGTKGKPVRSQQARDYRRRMYEGINKLAKNLSKEEKRQLSHA
ncbi:hypothetical protein HYT56_02230 [Candidatus Woesearchaeota archaeon]|nr:hypothetical protein [Candidatus Woesearchaeota archaeon]